MSRQLTVKQLRYLCAVAEQGHFGHAAKACHVSQSTLSAGILELEETLGTALVERNNRHVLLTALGQDVVRRAEDILRDFEVSVPYQATSLNTIVQMVANGIGITLLPRMAVDARILSGTDVKVMEFSDKGVARSIGLMWRRKTPRRADFRMLGDFIRGQCG